MRFSVLLAALSAHAYELHHDKIGRAHDFRTLDSLRLHFRRILDESGSHGHRSALQKALLCSRLEEMHLNRVHVDASSIAGAGKGLFASQKILAGEVFTCYPGDALLFRSASADDSLDVLSTEERNS